MSLIEQTLCLVPTFSNRHVCSWRHFLGYIYSCFSHFFKNNKKTILLTSSLFLVRLFCKLSSSGSSNPYHFGGTRSVLSWETIVHYPRYKLRVKFVLRTQRYRWAWICFLLSNLLFALQVCFFNILCFWF